VGLGRSNEAAAAADLSAKGSLLFFFFDDEACFDDIGSDPDTMGAAALMADPERGEKNVADEGMQFDSSGEASSLNLFDLWS
jgi:hypothetical protein